jgi:hypothetical protein
MAKVAKKPEQESVPSLLRISIDKLRFNPENPRFATALPEGATQAQIRDTLIQNMEARDLVSSFIKNGYLPYEPIIVKSVKGGLYTVLEGNRRLAALQSMRDSKDAVEQEAFAKHGLGNPPCVIFEGAPEQELAYLGLRHISKTKDWSASAKAAFIESVLARKVSLKEAARLTNTTETDLRLMLLTRRLFERAGALGIDIPAQGAAGEVSFWHLGDAIRRTRTKKYLQIVENANPLKSPAFHEDRFESLVGWLYGNPKTKQPRIVSSIRDIPDLDKCLGNPKSTEALEAGASLEEALQRLEGPVVKTNAQLDRAKDYVQKATGFVSDVPASSLSNITTSRKALAVALDTFDAAFDARARRAKK